MRCKVEWVLRYRDADDEVNFVKNSIVQQNDSKVIFTKDHLFYERNLIKMFEELKVFKERLG